MNHQRKHDIPEDRSPREARKPYVKPTYQREQIFETMALSCGKVQSTEGQCHHNRKNS